MESKFSFKDFEQVRLKATYSIEVGGRHIDPGETIAVFDKIQIARIAEEVERVTANGGFDNRAHVFWTTTKDEIINFAQGVFSSTQFAILINSGLLEIEEDKPISITEEEHLESNENGVITLAKSPNGQLWIYNKSTGEKITNYTRDDKVITITESFLDVVVVYTYDYFSGAKCYHIGKHFTNGFLELEGRTRVKDDKNGHVVTGILKIPHLRLMSNLSISLGAQASPVVGNFSAVAVPVGSRERSYVSEFYILNDDIESDL